LYIDFELKYSHNNNLTQTLGITFMSKLFANGSVVVTVIISTAEGKRIENIVSQIAGADVDCAFEFQGRNLRPVLMDERDQRRQILRNGNGGMAATLSFVADDESREAFSMKLSLKRRDQSISDLRLEYCPKELSLGRNAEPIRLDAGAEKGLYRLGFALLTALFGLFYRDSGELFEADTVTMIDQGYFRVVRQSFVFHRACSDVPAYLRRLDAMYGQKVAAGSGFVSLAEHLGLMVDDVRDYYSNEVTILLFQKRNGGRPAWSIRLCSENKRFERPAQWYGDRDGVEDKVRFEVTLHGPALVSLIEEAEQRLVALQKSDSPIFAELDAGMVDEFFSSVPAQTASCVESAIHLLPISVVDGKIERRSFTAWLEGRVLSGVLRLDAVGSFDQDLFKRFLSLDDPSAIAWRQQEELDYRLWTRHLQLRSGQSGDYIFERRAAWMRAFRIDISIPYAFYRDVTILSSLALSNGRERSALLGAIQSGGPRINAAALVGAMKRVNKERLEAMSPRMRPTASMSGRSGPVAGGGLKLVSASDKPSDVEPARATAAS
jgi:hypothetical protein